jgi:CBS domain containing-hemolysin-like protein
MFRRRRAPDRPPHRGSSTGTVASGEDQEQTILAALADLRDTTVREVMTPRVDVVGLAIPVRAEDVARAVRESGHSRFPVYDDDLDNLVASSSSTTSSGPGGRSAMTSRPWR